MKKLIALLCLLYFMCNPIPTTTAQTDSTSVNKVKEANIKQQIADNIDSIKTIMSEKIIQSRPKVVIHKKYYRHVERDTVYIDTCIAKVHTKYIFQQAPVTPALDNLNRPEKKLRWYQRIFKRHRKD